MGALVYLQLLEYTLKFYINENSLNGHNITEIEIYYTGMYSTIKVV